MATIDLKKVLRDLYRAGESPERVDVPERPFLMIDGTGDPNTAPEYADAVGALYPIAYGLRAEVRAATGDAYTVMPLEGLWWADDMERFGVGDKENWFWTMMITVPEAVSPELCAEVAARVTKAKALAAGGAVRLERYHEGPSAQILHRGPYAAEAPTIEKLHTFIAESGHRLRGKHHEIYLSDPRRIAPEKMRTIIRQPVE